MAEGAQPREPSVWVWVGLVLTVFGAIVTGSGIYYLFAPPPPAIRLAELNPCLWWGAVTLAAGLLFLGGSWVSYRRQGNIR